MTHEECLNRCIALENRAKAYEQSVANRAKSAFDKAFESKSEGFICFLYAHNWKGQSWLTVEQNRACRLVGYLDEKRWNASRITDKMISRIWREWAKQ